MAQLPIPVDPPLIRRSLWLVWSVSGLLALVFWLAAAFLSPDSSSRHVDRVVANQGHGDVLLSRDPPVPMDSVQLTLPAAAVNSLSGITISVGSRTFSFTGRQILQTWKRVPVVSGGQVISDYVCFVAPPEVRGPPSHLPWMPRWINYPGDGALLWRAPLWRLLALVALLGVMATSLRWSGFARALVAAVTPPNAAPSSGKSTWPWLAVGVLIVITALIIVEVNQPFYFTQNDAYSLNHPRILLACKAMLQGRFPEWDPYQLMGNPTSAVAFDMALYPLMPLMYLISSHLLGQEYAMMEVFAFTHLLATYFFTFWAGRKLALRHSVAMIASLSFVLSGFNLIGGRSWCTVIGIMPYLPLLVMALVELHRGRVGWKWSILTALALGLFFYVGFTPYWMLWVMFMALAVVIWILTREIPFRRALWAVHALLLGMALCLPLLYTQLTFTRDATPSLALNSGIEAGLHAMIFPWPLSHATHPNGWGNIGKEYVTQFYYSGTLLCLASLVGLGGLAAFKWKRKLVADNLWLILAVFALLIALGQHGILWPAMTLVPPFSQVRNNPFRLLLFVNLFLALGGGLVLERWLCTAKRPRFWSITLTSLVTLLLLYHSSIARASFGSYSDPPYPALSPELQALAADHNPYPQRILPIGNRWSPQPGLPLTMIQTFPTIYHILSFDGYDPAVEAKPAYQQALKLMGSRPLEAAKAYGIKWLLLSRVASSGAIDSSRQELAPAVDALLGAAAPAQELPQVELRQLPDPDPLAFPLSAPRQALPIKFHTAGVDVDLAALPASGLLVVNVLYWPDWVAAVDGKVVDARPDEWGRVVVTVPAGSHQLTLRYRPPWMTGIFIGLVALLAAVILGRALTINQYAAAAIPPDTASRSPAIASRKKKGGKK